MAEAVVRRACRKLRSAIGDEANKRLNFTGHLQEMLDFLPSIEAVTSYAETSPKEDFPILVNAAAYRVCNMVDQLKETKFPPAEAGHKMARLLGRRENVVLEPNSKDIMLGQMKEIKEELQKLHQRSADIEKDVALLQARAGIVGRKEDVENILDLLSRCHSSRVFPNILLIRGEDGIGKATVAAMVFDDDQFKCYSRVWINHSDRLPFFEIAKYIVSQLVSSGEEMSGLGSDGSIMEYLTNRLHELVNDKKLLVVLHNDDDRHWKKLKGIFSEGGMGTQVTVIATTTKHRPYNEDDFIESFGVQSHILEPLSQEACFSIIKQAAVRSEQRYADKEYLGQVAPILAQHCRGLPMTAQLFGIMPQLEEYRQCPKLEALFHSTDDFATDPVYTSLKSTYRSMAPNLKLCFVYCTFVFMANEYIVKEDIIHQWIALELIEPSNVFSISQLAEQYIKRLLDMSLLQIAKSSRSTAKDGTRAISLTMHKMVNEGASRFFNYTSGLLEGGRSYVGTSLWSYACVINHNQPLDMLFPDQNLRALCFMGSVMNLGNDSFSFARNLRVLELKYDDSMKELPESICQLSHLGYLTLLDWSSLVTLPEWIGDLKYLLHIELSSCSELVNLPESFGRLINLVHISLSGCTKLKNLPKSFGKLVKLVFINLSGCLALENLPESFGKLTKAEHINLSGCQKLVNLPLSFGQLINLVFINLSGCLALVNLPESFVKLKLLEAINLSGCPKLVNLPESLGKLTNLVHINLSGCSGLKELPESFGKLISLVQINLSGCYGLSTLPGSFGDLQNLLHVDLSRCNGLSKLPESFAKLKKLVHLDLSFCSCFDGIHTALGGIISLEHLNLSHPCCYPADYHHLHGLKELLSQFIRLRYLNLSVVLNYVFCNKSEKENLEYIEFISGLFRLEFLDLSHSIFLRELPESIMSLPKLHTLDLSGCIRLAKVGPGMGSVKLVVLSNLESYKFEVGKEDVINNYGLLVDVRCKELEITCIDRMKYEVEAHAIRLQEKTNLQKLKLCWNVNSRSFAVDRDYFVLGPLMPPHSLQQLELHGYGGRRFPSWLTWSISSFNLVEVTMEDIPNCETLPPLGDLPNLRRVVLRRMKNIKRIDAGDLIGENGEAFSRLSSFTVDDMLSLYEFKTKYRSGGEELLLQVNDEFVANNCPDLSFVPLPPRARRLVISDCNSVMACWQNRAGTQDVECPCDISSTVTEVTELVVGSCWLYPRQWCLLLNHLPGLRSLTIDNCDNIVCSPEFVGALSSLQTLCLSHCEWMTVLPGHLGGLSSLRELQIKSCSQFQRLPYSMKQHTSLQSLHFSDCDSLKVLPEWIGTLTSLQKLTIERCASITRMGFRRSELTERKDLRIIITCSPGLEPCRLGLQLSLGPMLQMELTPAPASEQSSEIVEDAWLARNNEAIERTDPWVVQDEWLGQNNEASACTDPWVVQDEWLGQNNEASACTDPWVVEDAWLGQNNEASACTHGTRMGDP